MFRIIFILIIISLFFFSGPTILLAQETGVEITPHVIDEKAKARDLFKYTVKLKNVTDRKLTLYPMINDISVVEGRQEVLPPSQLDRTLSIAAWTRIPRGAVKLMPGDEEELALEINVSLYAVPGKRYAILGFPEAPNRYEAEDNMFAKSYANILINFAIEENIVEKAQIELFGPQKNLYLNLPVIFETTIENFGNREITPEGSIFLFNRRGEEVGKIDVNSDSLAIGPESKKTLKSEWLPDKATGKYKARLEMEYGQLAKRDLQDTAFFWVIPLPILFVFVGALFFFVLLLTIFIFRRTYQSHQHPPQAADNEVIDLKKISKH